MTQTMEIATWWGRHRMPADRADLWTIGSLELMIEHHERYWLIHWRHVEKKTTISRSTGLSTESVKSFLSTVQPPSALSMHFPAKVRSMAIPATNPNEDLIFSPILPEESLIMSLESAAVLDPTESLSSHFFIPLAIKIETVGGQGAPRHACEIPLLPMVRTWGGTNPLTGELALTPHESLHISRWSDFKPRLDVAGIAVIISNHGSDSVFVDRLLIPCSRLALYHSPQSGFWCESLDLHAEADAVGVTAFGTTNRTLPREAGATTLVAPARQTPSESISLKGLANFRSTIGTSVENLFKERG